VIIFGTSSNAAFSERQEASTNPTGHAIIAVVFKPSLSRQRLLGLSVVGGNAIHAAVPYPLGLTLPSVQKNDQSSCAFMKEVWW